MVPAKTLRIEAAVHPRATTGSLRSSSVGGDARNDETSGTALVVNELLTYVFDAHNNHPADTIKQNVLNFYSSTAIHDAKLALWNAYEKHLSKLTERRGPNQSTRELADILGSIDGLERLFFNADTLPVLFVAVNLRNLPVPCEQRKDNVIEDILSRLKRIEMREACAPATASATAPTTASAMAPTTAPATAPTTTTAPATAPTTTTAPVTAPTTATAISATYADAAKSRRTDTVPPVVLQSHDVRKRRANEHMPPACDDSRNTPRHVTSSLFPEAMRYDGEGFAIPPEHAKKARRREMRERHDATNVQPAMKKRRNFTTGTRTSVKLMSAPRRYELFVFRVNENATADDIKDYINCDTMAVIDIACMSNENNYTKSYRVVV